MTHSEQDYAEYLECVSDLMSNEAVQSMREFHQHGGVDILEHSLCVSYLSFRLAKVAGMDFRSAARGGLLHDFFLYQRHVNKPYKGWHTLGHPKLALKNALEHFELNEIEQDIIAKHMWPINLRLPLYNESYLVSMVDKYCCVAEFSRKFGDRLSELLLVQGWGEAITEQYAAQAV